MKRYMRMRMASRPQVYDQLQDQREDTFSKLKTQLQLVNDLNEVLEQTADSNIKFQYDAAVNDLKKSMNELQQAGMSISDLYSRFGKDILKAQVLKARSDISEIEAKQGEQHLADTVNEDEIIARSNLNEQIDGRVQLINELQRQGYNVTSMRSEDVQRLNARIAGLANASQQQQNLRRGFQATGQRFRGDAGPPGGAGGPPGGRAGLMPAPVNPAQVAIPLHGQAIPLGADQQLGRPLQLQRQASFAQAAGRARVQGRPRLASDTLIQEIPREQRRDMAIVRQARVNHPIARSLKMQRLEEWEQQGFTREALEWYYQHQQEFDDEQEEVRSQDFSEAPFRGQAAPFDLNMASAEAPLHHTVPVSQPVRPGHAEHRQAQITQIQQDLGRDLFQSIIQATQQQIGESRIQYMRRLEEEAKQQAEIHERPIQQPLEEQKQPIQEESSILGPSRDPDERIAEQLAFDQIRQLRQRTFSEEAYQSPFQQEEEKIDPSLRPSAFEAQSLAPTDIQEHIEPGILQDINTNLSISSRQSMESVRTAKTLMNRIQTANIMQHINTIDVKETETLQALFENPVLQVNEQIGVIQGSLSDLRKYSTDASRLKVKLPPGLDAVIREAEQTTSDLRKTRDQLQTQFLKSHLNDKDLREYNKTKKLVSASGLKVPELLTKLRTAVPADILRVNAFNTYYRQITGRNMPASAAA